MCLLSLDCLSSSLSVCPMGLVATSAFIDSNRHRTTAIVGYTGASIQRSERRGNVVLQQQQRPPGNVTLRKENGGRSEAAVGAKGREPHSIYRGPVKPP